MSLKVLIAQSLFATLWAIAQQASLPMGFSRQEYWSGLPFSSPGGLPDPGSEPRSPALQAGSLPSEPPESLSSKCNSSTEFCFFFSPLKTIKWKDSSDPVYDQVMSILLLYICFIHPLFLSSSHCLQQTLSWFTIALSNKTLLPTRVIGQHSLPGGSAPYSHSGALALSIVWLHHHPGSCSLYGAWTWGRENRKLSWDIFRNQT